MLLEARAKDPELAKTIIPLLEKEIIENPILLDKLEVLNREKAYRAYLEKKAQEEKLENANNRDDSRRVFILENEENAL